MEFGIFNSLYLPRMLRERDPEHAEQKRLLDEVEWVKAADRAGFKYTWATEHHFLTEYSHLSSNETFLAYVAALTTNIHLGSGSTNAIGWGNYSSTCIDPSDPTLIWTCQEYANSTAEREWCTAWAAFRFNENKKTP